jgi:hypothetical protein
MVFLSYWPLWASWAESYVWIKNLVNVKGVGPSVLLVMTSVVENSDVGAGLKPAPAQWRPVNFCDKTKHVEVFLIGAEG